MAKSKIQPRTPWWENPQVTEPKVLVAYEKHGMRFYHIPDEDTLQRVAQSLLRERDKIGYYDPSSKPVPLDFKEASIESMPQSMQAQARKTFDRYKWNMGRYEGDMATYQEVQKAIAEGGPIAWKVLKGRSDGEYERVVLERYTKP